MDPLIASVFRSPLPPRTRLVVLALHLHRCQKLPELAILAGWTGLSERSLRGDVERLFAMGWLLHNGDRIVLQAPAASAEKKGAPVELSPRRWAALVFLGAQPNAELVATFMTQIWADEIRDLVGMGLAEPLPYPGTDPVGEHLWRQDNRHRLTPAGRARLALGLGRGEGEAP